MKKFKVELESLGINKKTLFVNDFAYDLVQGQIVRESNVTKTYPAFFLEILETEAETKEEETEVETEEETKEEETEVETEEEETEVETEVETESPINIEEAISAAKSLKTKVELAQYAKSFSIELSTANSLKNMVKEFETIIIKG